MQGVFEESLVWPIVLQPILHTSRLKKPVKTDLLLCDRRQTSAQLSTIKDWDQLHQRHLCVVFARLLCSPGITSENQFHTSSSHTLSASNDITSGHAHSPCSEIWLL